MNICSGAMLIGLLSNKSTVTNELNIDVNDVIEAELDRGVILNDRSNTRKPT